MGEGADLACLIPRALDSSRHFSVPVLRLSGVEGEEALRAALDRWLYLSHFSSLHPSRLETPS